MSPHDLEVYWSHQWGDSALPSLRTLYPLSDYQADADFSATMSATGYNQYSAAQYAGYRTETDFAYLCTAKWASEYPLWRTNAFQKTHAFTPVFGSISDIISSRSRYFSTTPTSPVWELQFAYGFDSRYNTEPKAQLEMRTFVVSDSSSLELYCFVGTASRTPVQ